MTERELTRAVSTVAVAMAPGGVRAVPFADVRLLCIRLHPHGRRGRAGFGRHPQHHGLLDHLDLPRRNRLLFYRRCIGRALRSSTWTL